MAEDDPEAIIPRRPEKSILVLSPNIKRAEAELAPLIGDYDRIKGYGIFKTGLPFRIISIGSMHDIDRTRGLRPGGVILLGFDDPPRGFRDYEDFLKFLRHVFPHAEFSTGMPKDPSKNFYKDECPECGCSDWGPPMREPIAERLEESPYWVEDLATIGYQPPKARHYRECNYCGEKVYEDG